MLRVMKCKEKHTHSHTDAYICLYAHRHAVVISGINWNNWLCLWTFRQSPAVPGEPAMDETFVFDL